MGEGSAWWTKKHYGNICIDVFTGYQEEKEIRLCLIWVIPITTLGSLHSFLRLGFHLLKVVTHQRCKQSLAKLPYSVLFFPSSTWVAASLPWMKQHVCLKKSKGGQMIGMVEGDVYIAVLLPFEVPLWGHLFFWTQKRLGSAATSSGADGAHRRGPGERARERAKGGKGDCCFDLPYVTLRLLFK